MPHELPKSYEPGEIEKRWAEYWITEKLFSVQAPPKGESRPVFTLLLPPPNVTGSLHMGHMFEQTQMDIVVRWHRMRGFLTLWLPGTDHAGIATQLMVERQLATEGKKRAEMGREKFIERVWEWKRHYGGRILDQMKRLGASVDWEREYFTMDENLSRAVREVFVRLHEEGLIYRAKYIVNWCPRCETAISDLEVKHEEVAGKLWEIRYPVIGAPSDRPEFITVATTRPETMLGDTAIAVNVKDARYKHLHGKKVLLPLMNREIPIITDELAQPEFGTGAVKVTPAHDPNDFQAGLRHNLPQIELMDEHAVMNQNAGPYSGLDRYAARKRVLADLAAGNFLVGEKEHTLALGKCDRCGTVVEPRLSTQWFIKIKPLAEKAIRAVESGEITIVPENYRTIYLNWMRDIHDWCISRQLWWGHRIPAWHCSCGEIIVAREAPAKCAECGGELKQDTDVLDTWFSSGLLPFTTLGWPDKTRDLEVFYPNALMITGFDILFFWLARMIMFGCHFMQGHEQDAAVKAANEAANGETGVSPVGSALPSGDTSASLSAGARRSIDSKSIDKNDSVPFRHVYIHMLVRDAERQKMSKTKGNVVDPLDVIQRFGTDATRFTLAAMAAPGTDVAFNESRTEGYRAFANKIWNAARFMFMNVDRVAPGLRPGDAGSVIRRETRTGGTNKWDTNKVCNSSGIAGFQADTLEDRWILSHFNRVTREVNDALGTFRFHEAANKIYDFFWGEFCDWYLELVKLRFSKQIGSIQRDLFSGSLEEQKVAQIGITNLWLLFEAALRLLHPVMPFITEEIWHAMYDGKSPSQSIALAAYPQADDAQISLAAETEMAILQDLIVSIRNLRAELKVEPREKVPIIIFGHAPEIHALITQNCGAVERLANVEAINFSDNPLTNIQGARSTARFDVHVVYERWIDKAAECERLKKELEKIEKGIASGQKQLSNEGFLAKAPANVVENIQRQQQDLAILKEKTLSKMKELGCK